MEKILLGTSGWSYEDWIGPFYLEKEDQLGFYGQVFKTVEINSTFYRVPPAWMVKVWVKNSPEDFVFSAKIPRTITHRKKLVDAREELNDFLKVMRPLQTRQKLGPLLIQLPPKFEFNIGKLRRFLEILPSEQMFSIEFRDVVWLKGEVYDLLKEFNVAYTVVDEPLLPPVCIVTADFSYVRWHGKGKRPWYNYHYSLEELREWVGKLKELKSKTRIVYGYFNNHFKGFAPKNCLEMIELMALASGERASEAKERIEKYFSEGIPIVPPPLKPKVEVSEMTFDSLIKAFMDRKRLKRAVEIASSEVKLVKTDSRIRSRVKDYFVEIDSRERYIVHDCADWGRTSVKKMFCKHVGALFMVLPRNEAVKLLSKIYLEKEKWKFKPLI